MVVIEVRGFEPPALAFRMQCSDLIELHFDKVTSDLIGVTGFEPATLGAQVRRSTILSYTPTKSQTKKMGYRTGIEPVTSTLARQCSTTELPASNHSHLSTLSDEESLMSLTTPILESFLNK